MILGKSDIRGRIISITLPFPFTMKLRHGTFTYISEPYEEGGHHVSNVLVNDIDVTVDITPGTDLIDLVLEWQGLASSATDHFGHYDAAWYAHKQELDQRTRQLFQQEGDGDDA